MRAIDANALKEWLTNPIGFRADCEDCYQLLYNGCVECIINEVIDRVPTINATPLYIGNREVRLIDAHSIRRYFDRIKRFCSRCIKCTGKLSEECIECILKDAVRNAPTIQINLGKNSRNVR